MRPTRAREKRGQEKTKAPQPQRVAASQVCAGAVVLLLGAALLEVSDAQQRTSLEKLRIGRGNGWRGYFIGGELVGWGAWLRAGSLKMNILRGFQAHFGVVV